MTMQAGSAGRVSVLMGTLNGARYLDGQIASIAAQTWPAIDLHVSDDGSHEGTLAALTAWQSRWSKGRFTLRRGPRDGFAENYRSLITDAGLEADYTAFADQDDEWLPDKLATAVTALDRVEAGRPGLYCGRTLLIDEVGKQIGLAPLRPRPPAFANALVQSIAGGNTMVLNRAGLAVLAEASRRTGFVSHDWWAYLIVSGAGGRVHYDPVPRVRYRQHEGNLVGSNRGLAARMQRLRLLADGRFADFMARNLRGLEACRDLLDAEARHRLDAMLVARAQPGLRCLGPLRGAGVFRQTRAEQVVMLAAGVFGRL